MGKDYNEFETFWAGSFGNEYIERNNDEIIVKNNIILFAQILDKVLPQINSVLELGANIGNNIKALQFIKPELDFSAVEINNKASKDLRKLANVYVIESSIRNFNTNKKFDLVLCKGILIHLGEEELSSTYEKIYECSGNYILFVEYFSKIPVEVNYRGHTGKLFKRDFAGEIMNKYKNLELIDYGFKYDRDYFTQDNLTWFLMKKHNT